MDGQVDSLDHIQAITGEQNANRNQGLDEPRYDIYPNSNDNLSSSFGAGGRISQVIDPEYRPPAPTAFVTPSPITFADLNPQSNFVDPKLNTLHQYGPPQPELPRTSSRPQFIHLPSSISRPHHSLFDPRIQNPGSLAQHPQAHPDQTTTMSHSSASQMPTNSYSHNSSTNATSEVLRMTDKQPVFQIGPYISPTTIADRSNQRTNIPTSGGSIEQNFPLQNIPLPPNNPSPPLDQLSTEIGSMASNTSANVAQNTSGKVPKKSAASNSSMDVFDTMDLLGLQSAYRKTETDVLSYQRHRANIERSLNEILRGSKGRNVELDPNFRQKKDDQKQCDRKLLDLKEKLSKIDEKLKSRFNHKMQPGPTQQTKLQSTRQPRAKMSTATPTRTPTPKSDTPEPLKEHKAKRNQLCLKDPRYWCQSCDLHLDNLKEFCEHLHKRDHNLNAGVKPTPWRTTVSSIDEKKSYEQLKCNCSKLERELPGQFSMESYDETLCTNLKDKDKKIKNFKAARQKGSFDPNDPLFEIKGYQHLIPITGFYCKLCDRTLCDHTEVEQHLKGSNHNYNHAKSVALDPSNEVNFRTKLDKSYQKSSEKDSRREKPASPVKSRTSPVVLAKATTSSSSSQLLPKKTNLNTHVDNDETDKDKFTKVSNDRVSNKASKVKSKAYLSDDSPGDEYAPINRVAKEKPVGSKRAASPVKPKNRKLPEIVPITKDRPTATLKRLRNEPQRPPSPEQINVLSDSDATTRNSPELDRIDIPRDIHIDAGDPDSPFPHLEMSVTGNIHLKMLKDPRLKLPCKVKINRINIDDYNDILLESTSLWTRVTQVVAKKEKVGNKDDFKTTTKTQPLYFDKDDEDIPVDVDGDDKAGAKGGSDMKISDTDGESGLQAENFDMSFLDNFFCEK